MYNDYSGKQLHDARYQEWLNEAEGGQRIAAAAEDAPTRRSRTWMVIALGVVIVALAAALILL